MGTFFAMNATSKVISNYSGDIKILAMLGGVPFFACVEDNKQSATRLLEDEKDKINKMNLSGKWKFVAPDNQEDFIKYLSGELSFNDSIILPGSIAENKKETKRSQGQGSWEDKPDIPVNT